MLPSTRSLRAVDTVWRPTGTCAVYSVCFSNAVIEKATVLASAYPSALDDSLGNELIQLRSFIKPEDDTSPKGLLRKILVLDTSRPRGQWFLNPSLHALHE